MTYRRLFVLLVAALAVTAGCAEVDSAVDSAQARARKEAYCATWKSIQAAGPAALSQIVERSEALLGAVPADARAELDKTLEAARAAFTATNEAAGRPGDAAAAAAAAEAEAKATWARAEVDNYCAGTIAD